MFSPAKNQGINIAGKMIRKFLWSLKNILLIGIIIIRNHTAPSCPINEYINLTLGYYHLFFVYATADKNSRYAHPYEIRYRIFIASWMVKSPLPSCAYIIVMTDILCQLRNCFCNGIYRQTKPLRPPYALRYYYLHVLSGKPVLYYGDYP